VFCEAIEQLQRSALERARPELVVTVDRSGLNEHHPMVGRLYQAIDRVLWPIVQAEERRAGAHLIGAPKAPAIRSGCARSTISSRPPLTDPAPRRQNRVTRDEQIAYRRSGTVRTRT